MANDRKNEIFKALRSLKGADILAELGHIALMPEIGTVAGQAVASLVMRKLGLSFGAPINDVDVFLPVGSSPRARDMADQAEQRVLSRKVLSSLASHVTRASITISHHEYTGMAHATAKEGYLILSTAREGMLNEVAYERTWLDARIGESLSVIRGFDLNSVQVGVDAASGALVWTPGFEDFLSSGQLLVVNVNTPFHTATRYFKKKAELGCFGDDELNMAICALPSARGVFSRLLPGTSIEPAIAGRYGSKVHEQYAELGDLIAPWFKEVKVMDKANIWTMQPVFSGREESLRLLRGSAHPESAEGIWRGDIDQFMFANASQFCASILKPESKAGRERRSRLDASMSKAGASIQARSFFSGLAQTDAKRYFDGKELSEHSAKVLARLLGQHPLLSDPLSNLTLSQQGAAAIALAADEKEHGQKIYGWLESIGAARGGVGFSSVETLLMDTALRHEFYAKQQMGGLRQLAAPLELPAMGALGVSVARSLLKVTFQELLTLNELEAEGRALRHCVGGYANSIESGKSRIFKVEGPTGHDRATMELGLAPSAKEMASVRQIRGLANRQPGAAARHAAEMAARACGKERSDQLLEVAAALVGALDESAISPDKLKSARALLRAALNEAKDKNGARNSALKARVSEGMAKYFPEPPALSGASISLRPKRWLF